MLEKGGLERSTAVDLQSIRCLLSFTRKAEISFFDFCIQPLILKGRRCKVEFYGGLFGSDNGYFYFSSEHLLSPLVVKVCFMWSVFLTPDHKDFKMFWRPFLNGPRFAVGTNKTDAKVKNWNFVSQRFKVF